MRIMVTDKRETEIKLDKRESETLARAAVILGWLAKHYCGKEEIAASEAFAPVAKRWGPREEAK